MIAFHSFLSHHLPITHLKVITPPAHFLRNRFEFRRISLLNALMHVHLLSYSPLLPKAHPTPLNHTNNSKDKRNRPHNPVQSTNRRTRARNIADLHNSLAFIP